MIMRITEAKHSWAGTAGLAYASQLVNGTILKQVSAPNRSTGDTASRLTVFFSAKPTENLRRTDTVKTRTTGKRRGTTKKGKPKKN